MDDKRYVMGIKKNIIKENNYKDSVFLMQIAGNLEKSQKEINAISLVMGTPANKEILKSSGLLTNTGEKADVSDLIIAIDAKDQPALDSALEKIEEMFSDSTAGGTSDLMGGGLSALSSIDAAIKVFNGANFALISVPGDYAAREAHKALDSNLNVMLFSDNVSLEDEITLKNKARAKNLLLMGPDCGTAIIHHVPLGFANAIPKGSIGLVAASGSGLQEVSVIISKYGEGITQAFGTGGRDLKKEVGGITMIQCLEFLKNDPDTKVIVLISKPPHPDIAKKILKKASQLSGADFPSEADLPSGAICSLKPVVVCFLGASDYPAGADFPSDADFSLEYENIHFVGTLEGAAIAATQLAKGEQVILHNFTVNGIENLISDTAKNIPHYGKYIRGLYAGGTLCDEAIDILKKYKITPYSNVASDIKYILSDSNKSIQHTFIDMGEDEFTRGRPHPMIDGTLRNKRMLKEAEDDEVAIILFDIVLGYGANPSPAGEMEDTLKSIKGKKVLVASVCGTDSDPQNYSKQVEILKKYGVIVLPTNAQAARFAGEIIKIKSKKDEIR